MSSRGRRTNIAADVAAPSPKVVKPDVEVHPFVDKDRSDPFVDKDISSLSSLTAPVAVENTLASVAEAERCVERSREAQARAREVYRETHSICQKFIWDWNASNRQEDRIRGGYLSAGYEPYEKVGDVGGLKLKPAMGDVD